MKSNHTNSLSLNLIGELKPIIKSMLHNSSLWNTVDIDYHPPKVLRLQTMIGNYRVYLHCILKTDKICLLHKHKWASVMEIIYGSYEMGVAYSEKEVYDLSDDDLLKIPILTKLRLTKGSQYEMTQTDTLHYVKPETDFCLSIMVTEDLYEEADIRKESLNHELKELTAEKKTALIKLFKENL